MAKAKDKEQITQETSEAQQEQEARNAARSTGSMAVESGTFRWLIGDPALEMHEYLESMEAAYQQGPREPEPQLAGQTAMPGFEDPPQPKPPKEKPPTAERIKTNLSGVAFVMDLLRSPEVTLEEWPGVPPGYLTKYLRRSFLRLVNIVAEQTGADPEQIADKKRRTPQQEQLLMEAAAKEQVARMDTFFASRYMQAVIVVSELPVSYPDPAADIPDAYTIQEQCVLYFFAKHPEIMPIGTEPLSEEQVAELKETFARLDAFYMEQTNGGESEPDGAEVLYAFIERENPAPEAENIAAALTVIERLRPNKYVMTNTPVMNALRQTQIIESPGNANGFDIPSLQVKGKRKPVSTFVMAVYDPGDTGIAITDAHLTQDENNVFDGVVSCFVEAEREGRPPIFTIDSIYDAMPGGGDKPSKKQRAYIAKTMEKFRRLDITLDATAELRKRGIIGEDATYRRHASFLSMTYDEYTVKGKKSSQSVIAYKINEEPILLTHARLTKQIITLPRKAITIEKVSKDGRPSGRPIPMTSERRAMTGYILRRLAIMKHDQEKAKDKKRKYDARRKKDPSLEEKPLAAFREQRDTILFDTLFKEAGIALPDATKDRLDKELDSRKFCFDVLDYQKAIGTIKGYKRQTRGRKITGVTIEL